MRYEFICDDCGTSKEFQRPMSEGPPKVVICDVCTDSGDKEVFMRHEFGGNFILKGDGWAGKDLKQREYKSSESAEQTEHQLNEDNRNQRIVEEVSAERRKGSKASREFQKHNPQKMVDYDAAIKKGYRAKNPKSYTANAESIRRAASE